MNIEYLKSVQSSGFWYLASPYSDNSRNKMATRAHAAKDFCGMFVSLGVFVYSPIWACHRIAIDHELPKDHEFWLEFNKRFLDASCGLLMADISGWTGSKGCQQELEYMKAAKKPCYLVGPGIIKARM